MLIVLLSNPSTEEFIVALFIPIYDWTASSCHDYLRISYSLTTSMPAPLTIVKSLVKKILFAKLSHMWYKAIHMKIVYTYHLEFRLRIRKIPHDLPRKVFD